MVERCTFCEFGKKKEEKLFENEHFFSRFDSFPVSPGHALVIPKRHLVDIASLTFKEWQILGESIKKVIVIIESTDLKKVYEEMRKNPASETALWFLDKTLNHPRINTKPDAYNHGVNDGKAAGRTVDHFHWHIIPRYEGDMEDPRGGVRYVIPNMGNYKISKVLCYGTTVIVK